VEPEKTVIAWQRLDEHVFAATIEESVGNGVFYAIRAEVI
jgi:hypothetical protein